jgi:prepilin-type N-terminal cleavage/methylation domain-containing protein
MKLSIRNRRRGFTLMEVALAVFLIGMAVLTFVALFPQASRCSHMSANYSQAITEVQHKVDELRAVGYGRLDYTNLQAAGVIDASPTASPFHFEVTDSLGTYLPHAVGTIALSSAGANLEQATITVTWTGAPSSAMKGTHAVTVLIPNIN